VALVTDTPYGRAAVNAIRQAVEVEKDFSGWLAAILATVAASHPDGSRALLAERSGSREAALLGRLLAGTAGENDENLHPYREEPDA
jgi:hypothetical protein